MGLELGVAQQVLGVAQRELGVAQQGLGAAQDVAKVDSALGSESLVHARTSPLRH